MPEIDAVFIAEVIFFDDNPADGRRRVAVCTSLEGALTALQNDGTDNDDLVATEVSPSALGSATSTTWAVHERGAAPDDEGLLWITREEVTRA
ncbi:hypothetical protein [Actinomadura sp. CNU-125]|uniref:hypothetical protein n=1 Tax=Actinomadura sp. CNU-125 TaxID=1904961 RepID=UPI001178B3B1|nr:hypothetical protein [Actinomadura sp. CNU-125]